jgi:Acyl-CoA carboxylase epsilon subunit
MTAVADTQALPLVAVTRGRPTAAELAAVVAVLLTAGSAGAAVPPAPPARPSAWANRSRVRSQLPTFGPGAWRASALPC